MQQVMYTESLNYYIQPDDGLYEKSKHVAKVFKCTRCAPLLFLIHKCLTKWATRLMTQIFHVFCSLKIKRYTSLGLKTEKSSARFHSRINQVLSHITITEQRFIIFNQI